jgi:hypothetical protein
LAFGFTMSSMLGNSIRPISDMPSEFTNGRRYGRGVGVIVEMVAKWYLPF